MNGHTQMAHSGVWCREIPILLNSLTGIMLDHRGDAVNHDTKWPYSMAKFYDYEWYNNPMNILINIFDAAVAKKLTLIDKQNDIRDWNTSCFKGMWHHYHDQCTACPLKFPWFCCVLSCCGCTIDSMWRLTLSRVSSLALGQSYDCPSASEVTLNDLSKINHYLITTNHNEAQFMWDLYLWYWPH